MARILAASAVLFFLLGVASAQSLKGCYVGDGDSAAADASSDDMINSDCAEFCAKEGKPYSGTGGEGGRYCACLTEEDMGMLAPTKSDAANCDTPCPGKLEEMCGGGDNYVTIWSTGSAAKRMLSLREKLQNLRRALED
ncbi:PREDICTED: kremen protein 2-like [Branchiostoma belcheri]|uniref:Kremen protein 2-like n=1 Tax=Branchiostoma belcheri TaxID=7741 RepID=A0A6P4YVR8_BRABE|nr:PREDICTED: kremen protein 2-like [Branchiostoma belcheri]